MSIAMPQVHAGPHEKRAETAQAPIHGPNIISFPVENNTRDYLSHQEPLAAGNTFHGSARHDSFHQDRQGEVHGLENCTPLEVFNPDLHGASFLPIDSFDMSLSPTMMSRLDEQAFDELFHSGDGTDYDIDETCIRGNTNDLNTENFLEKTPE